MTIIYLSIYIGIILGIWALYAVVRMHAMKFKNFSTHIVPATNGLLIFLIILSILGFIIVFSIGGKNSNYEIDTSSKYDKVEEVKNEENSDLIEDDLKEEIIGDEYY